jgi:hypothetical protein
MAKPKPHRRKPGPKPRPEGATRSAVVLLRCRPAWQAWLEAAASRDGLTVADLLAAAVLDYALKHRHEPPPPR